MRLVQQPFILKVLERIGSKLTNNADRNILLKLHHPRDATRVLGAFL